jgi:predicted nucleic acid-binding protein
LGAGQFDTSVLIDYSKGVGPVVARLRAWATGIDEIGICGVQVAEYCAGIAATDRQDARTFLSAFLRWPITDLAALTAGIDRYDFAPIGVQIAAPDATVAGMARSVGDARDQKRA